MDNKSVKKDWKIAFLPGDGTGPEIMKVTLPVIRKAAASAGVRVSISIGDAGYNCISRYGTNLPQKTIDLLKRSDCVMKGPMTTPEGAGSEISAAVKIRKMFSLYADVRPCKTRKGVPAVKENVDLVIVRLFPCRGNEVYNLLPPHSGDVSLERKKHVHKPAAIFCRV